MLNYSSKSISTIFKKALYESKHLVVQANHISNNITKPFLTYENYNLKETKYGKNNKKQFSEKSSTEDLIEQILQTKANNAKKTFSAQENGNINSRNKSNYGYGIDNNSNNNKSYPSNNNNRNGNNIQNNYNNNSNGNGHPGNLNDYVNERDDHYSIGNNNNYSNSTGNNQNYNNNWMNYNNQNNPNNGNNYSGNNFNPNNNMSQGYRKRNRISILRDGMNISLNLRRPGVHSLKPESYVVLQLKEFKINRMGEIDPNDPRYIILSGSNLCKLLLLDPKTHIKNDAHLEKIVINQKNKVFTLEQNEENIYTASIKVYKQENINNENPQMNKEAEPNKEESLLNSENAGIDNQILVQSQIDLNPEDVMVLKIFAQVIL